MDGSRGKKVLMLELRKDGHWGRCESSLSRYVQFSEVVLETVCMIREGQAITHPAVPYRFKGLYTIGLVFMFLNMALFVFNAAMISTRFYFYPWTFRASLLHPTESLFIPASIISVGTILINITQYGTTQGEAGPWLLSTMVVLFWIYCGVAVIFSFGIYLIM